MFRESAPGRPVPPEDKPMVVTVLLGLAGAALPLLGRLARDRGYAGGRQPAAGRAIPIAPYPRTHPWPQERQRNRGLVAGRVEYSRRNPRRGKGWRLTG
jgi:hypothetical protein